MKTLFLLSLLVLSGCAGWHPRSHLYQYENSLPRVQK